MMQKVVVATNNQDKLREIKEILGDKFNLLSLKDVGLKIEIEENGNTFFDNALIKARTVSQITDSIALADDSGLEVDALDGKPGIYSARYAGEPCNDEKNIDKLLLALQGLPKEKRGADFVSVVVMYFPDGRICMAEGKAYGRILEERQGSGGFGYDPVFYSEELGKTFAEASKDEKNAVSHRGRALTLLANDIKYL